MKIKEDGKQKKKIESCKMDYVWRPDFLDCNPVVSFVLAVHVFAEE